MEYPGLEQLLAGFLNQDWPDDYADVWAAVAQFVRLNAEDASLVAAEVDRLLTAAESDADLARIVHEKLGSEYLPATDGWNYRDWLEEVARRVQEQLDE